MRILASFLCAALVGCGQSVPNNARCPDCFHEFSISEEYRGHLSQYHKTTSCPKCGRASDYGTLYTVYGARSRSTLQDAPGSRLCPKCGASNSERAYETLPDGKTKCPSCREAF